MAWVGAGLSAGLCFAAFVLDRGAATLGSSTQLALAGALLAAVVLDIAKGWRAGPENTLVWLDTRAVAIAPLRARLSRAGISSVAVGGLLNMLMPLGGPLVPAGIRVSGAAAEPRGRGRPRALAPAQRPKAAIAASWVAAEHCPKSAPVVFSLCTR